MIPNALLYAGKYWQIYTNVYYPVVRSELDPALYSGLPVLLKNIQIQGNIFHFVFNRAD